ncbi:response regulator [Bradyrhizobium diazoefficiens]|jgi:class 3 adenylate cyclase|nr:adenylate/guanylate cyclase domain-containing protein [Bradyrhizobium diazoefficiens]MBR0965377.1 response regulator [Bradyrhizobium diazoefficiens]MBR0980800.1 response regulator [Bradyrhizobium diazoefficiens]MBR1010594.1 response regulator [Bradyrhizobium diazoefficiens]MBR1016933.1 response regulator [Bradyrhizobium diazoefficiens]MBR1054340.1 response regulator [Bradyrhizobium diazoefficiens]
MTATILVVDDEPDLEALVLQKFRRQIRDGTVAFVFAHDGIEALASIEQHPHVDMVVSDINMPRMDGLSLLAKLQEADDKKSTIIVSAYGDMSNIRTAMNRGAFDFLTKPIDFGDLEMTIDKTIRHVETMREARRRQLEAERAHASLSRYFSPQIASRLAAIGDSDGMEVHWREIATIFTDITGFTSLVETAAPDVLGALLNEYVGGMTDVVFDHEGTVAKIIGDAIQVLFNAPGDQPDYARRSIACAHDLDIWAQAFRERWKEKGVNFGVTRIGIHAGPALVGNFGGSRFFDYTAYGDTINTAARLEAANKQLGTRICVSAAVADSAGNFRGRPVGDIMLRGRSEPLRAFEPLQDAAFKAPATAQYADAFAKLEAGDATAMPAFAALVGLHAEDALAGFQLKRLLNGAKGSRIQLD